MRTIRRACLRVGLILFLIFGLLNGGVAGDERADSDPAGRALPDWYPYVAADILEWAQPEAGVWIDLGAGTGGVALAVASSGNPAAENSTLVLVDPDSRALSRALQRGRARGLGEQWVAVVGVAEQLPHPDNSIDLVFSRGSIYFWSDPVAGIREIHRVLRPGGKAMIGGGLGESYPEWARREFIRRRRGNEDPESPRARAFARLRAPETFRKWAEEAGLTDFEVRGQGALPADDPATGLGIWLRFTKQESS